jgi:hypothetical protein
MSRIPLFLLALALLPGCTAFKPTTPASKELAATLLFVQGDKPLDVGSGIVSVGNYYFPSAPVKLAYIAPGGREIGYNCPGYIYVDGSPTVVQTFEGGKRYELFCRGGKPVIRVQAP